MDFSSFYAFLAGIHSAMENFWAVAGPVLGKAFDAAVSLLTQFAAIAWPLAVAYANSAFSAVMALLDYASKNPDKDAAIFAAIALVCLGYRAFEYFSRPKLSIVLPSNPMSPFHSRKTVSSILSAVISNEHNGTTAQDSKVCIKLDDPASRVSDPVPGIFLHWERLEYLDSREGTGISISKTPEKVFLAFQESDEETEGCWFASPLALTRVLDYGRSAPENYKLPLGKHLCKVTAICSNGSGGSILVRIISSDHAVELSIEKASFSEELSVAFSGIFPRKKP